MVPVAVLIMAPGVPSPLQAAVGAAAGRVGLGGHIQPRVRRGEGQVNEERLRGVGGLVVHDPVSWRGR